MAGTKRKITFKRGNGKWEAGGKPAKELKSDFPEGSGEYEIEISVATPTSHYLLAEDPIWIKKIAGENDDACPTSFGCQNIFSYKVTGPATMTLYNKNDEEDPTEYRYQLNVVDRVTGEDASIDPILSNGGRGGK